MNVNVVVHNMSVGTSLNKPHDLQVFTHPSIHNWLAIRASTNLCHFLIKYALRICSFVILRSVTDPHCVTCCTLGGLHCDVSCTTLYLLLCAHAVMNQWWTVRSILSADCGVHTTCFIFLVYLHHSALILLCWTRTVRSDLAYAVRSYNYWVISGQYEFSFKLLFFLHLLLLCSSCLLSFCYICTLSYRCTLFVWYQCCFCVLDWCLFTCGSWSLCWSFVVFSECDCYWKSRVFIIETKSVLFVEARARPGRVNCSDI